jgi:hypothetical protein
MPRALHRRLLESVCLMPKRDATGKPGKVPVTVALSVLNGMRTMPRLLDSVAGWTSGVVVFDTGSTDGTQALCRSRGCEVIECEWAGMRGQRQRCLDHCARSPWILLLDADEMVEASLRDAICAAVLSDSIDADGFEMRRMVHFEGAWLRRTFQPEFRLRLVRGGRARAVGSGLSGDGAHEHIVVDGPVRSLPGVLRHESWASVHDFWTRSPRYCLQAEACGESGGRVIDVLARPTVVFLKQYLLKRGFLDGRRGFLMAAMMATGNSMKQITLLRKRWDRQIGATAER